MQIDRGLPSIIEVQIEVQKLTNDINFFAETHPNVEGTEKLFRQEYTAVSFRCPVKPGYVKSGETGLIFSVTFL